MSNTRKVRIQVNRKTTAEWAASTLIPLQGEWCFDTDSGALKIGDGVNVYSALSEIGGSTDAGDLTTGTLDGDRLPGLSATKKGGVPATGTPSNQYLRDDGTWTTPAGASHDRQHAVDSTGDHTSDATPGVLLKAKATSGLPTASSVTESDAASAVSLKHANSNDPSAGEKAALAGTSGTPAADNTYVTNADARNTNARTPSAHKASHEPGGADAMAVDAAAATGSLRTIGTTATAACAGNDSRLSDARTPSAHKTSHEPSGGDAMTVDAAAATGSLRTLGTGATAACAGNDSRLSDSRTPTSHGNTAHSSTFITISDVTGTKIDDLTQGDDNTDLNASTSRHGLILKATAPGSGVRNVVAIDNTETAYKNTALVDSTNPEALGTAGPGTSLLAARRDHVHAMPAIDATAAASDNTTRDVTTSVHGLCPKAPNNTYAFLRADATYARPRANAAATTSSATPTPDADTNDVYCLTAQAEAAAFAAPSGTPVNGQKLVIRVKDNNTARALTWNAIYRACGVALPTTTVQNKTTYVGLIYNSADSKWDCVAVSTEA